MRGVWATPAPWQAKTVQVLAKWAALLGVGVLRRGFPLRGHPDPNFCLPYRKKTIVKNLLLAVLAVALLAGCQADQPATPTAAETTGTIDNAEAIIIRAVVDQWVAAGMPMGDDDQPAWRVGDDDAPDKAGDDDAPNHPRTACTVVGVPRCTTLANGMDKCRDMCGATFYVVEYSPGETICVSSGGAYVYACTGSNY